VLQFLALLDRKLLYQANLIAELKGAPFREGSTCRLQAEPSLKKNI
jgi:hypothetical protein